MSRDGQSKLRIATFNIRSYTHKVDVIMEILGKLDLDVLVLTETRLQREPPALSGFRIFRTQVDSRGGVAILVREWM
jgi:exonuclease III